MNEIAAHSTLRKSISIALFELLDFESNCFIFKESDCLILEEEEEEEEDSLN